MYVGRIRSLVTHSVLGLATLGIYSIVWFTRLNFEVRRARETGPHPLIPLLLFVLVPVIGWFVAIWISSRPIRRLQAFVDADVRNGSLTPSLWAIVPIVGWTISAAQLQSAANAAWERLHVVLGGAVDRQRLLECPQCTTRFEWPVHPFEPVRASCPKCGRAGEV